MQQETTYIYNNKEYKVIITRKKMRNIRYRLVGDVFKISAPYLASKGSIQRGLVKYAPYLVSRQKPAPIGNDYIYLYGYKYPLNSEGIITLKNGQIIKFSSMEDLEKKLRKAFLQIVTTRVRYYENLMSLKPHNVRVRKMSSRYGSNSKRTRTVCFSTTLYHYSLDIIDAIVVHELAHSIHFDHSPAFYDVVYKYCKNYDILHKKLKKGVYL